LPTAHTVILPSENDEMRQSNNVLLKENQINIYDAKYKFLLMCALERLQTAITEWMFSKLPVVFANIERESVNGRRPTHPITTPLLFIAIFTRC